MFELPDSRTTRPLATLSAPSFCDAGKKWLTNYQGITLDEGFRLDLLVDNQLIVELKSVEQLHPVYPKQLLTYLRLMNLPLGLLINFGAPLMKDGLKRVVNHHENFAASRLRVHKKEASQ